VEGATGYHVYYGTQSRVYTTKLDVGPAISASIGGLRRNETYYVTDTALGSWGESDDANEISARMRQNGTWQESR
jgi:hypothetical protein